MAHILIATVGTRGDVQPFVALGKTLVARGHTVTLSTGQGFDALTEGMGIETAPLSIDMQALVDMPQVQAAMGTLKGKWHAYKATQDIMRRQHEQLWAIATKMRPDVIVYNVKAFIVSHAARQTGAIAIPAFLQPAFSPTGAFANPLVKFPGNSALVNRLSWTVLMPLMNFGYRVSLGSFRKRHPDAKAARKIDVLAGYHPAGRPVPRLYAHSAAIVPRPDDWGPNDHVTGAWFTDHGKDWTPPPQLAAFVEAGPPPIYVGFGSMPGIDAEKTGRIIAAALQRTGQRAIVARGWGAVEGISQSDKVHVLDGAPHDWLFARCAAVIHHGGAGTTHEGLRWGRPTLICPVFGDQPFWGQIVHQQGAGPEPQPLGKLTVDALAAAFGALSEQHHIDAAETIGDAMAGETGTETAARLIEQALETT